MPKGPNGEKRPANAIGMSVRIAQIATGEVEETKPSGRRASGLAGAKVRAAALSAAERSKIAKAAAEARWTEKETVMTTSLSACDKVAAIYKAKREAGLVDVKFLLQSPSEISKEEVCAELIEFNEAIENQESTPLDFGDLSWKSAS